jgi:lysophospholipase L1-like esterase
VNEGGFHRAGSWLRWLTLMPTLPIVAVQAKRARRIIPRLPDAGGAVEGTCHATSASAPALNLLVLGESTVSGVGASTHELGLAGGIARALAAATGRDVRWLACGKNGATVAKVRDTLLPNIDGRPIDVAVLCVGANDAFRMTSLPRWRQGVTDVNRRLLERGCKRVFISQVPPVGQFPALPPLTRLVVGARMELLGGELPRLARHDERLVYCPIAFPTEHICADGIHPSESGYAEWGRQLAAHIAGACAPRGKL